MLSINRFIINSKANIILALLFISICSNSQNLVPNYSFEQHTNCGSGGGGGAVSWYSPVTGVGGLEYSYSNTCSTQPCCGIPSNTFGSGWQYARTGNAYASIFFSYNDGRNNRQYLQTKLIDSLIGNHYYFIEFYVNLFNVSKYAANNISLLVGDTAIISYGNKYSPAIPQIINYRNPIIFDTLNWIRVSGIYTAHGGEQYITIGNFSDDVHTDTSQLFNTPGGYLGSAYYIDDVSVIPLDSMLQKADAGRDTTITVGDSAFIGSYTNGIDTIQWLQNGATIIDSTKPGFWVYPTKNTYYVLTQTVNGYTSSDTVNVTVNPLPLQFISYFVNETKGHFVENKWTTANEINVHHYNIEKSNDGVKFNSIGTIKAQNKQANQYEFVDKNVSEGINYYRVVGMDNDGKKSYSEIKKISISNNEEIKVFPNPTKGEVNIQLPIKGNWQITATDIEGRVVWQQECNGCNGIEKHFLVGAKGIYFIKIINTVSGEQSVKKITLQY